MTPNERALAENNRIIAYMTKHNLRASSYDPSSDQTDNLWALQELGAEDED